MFLPIRRSRAVWSSVYTVIMLWTDRQTSVWVEEWGEIVCYFRPLAVAWVEGGRWCLWNKVCRETFQDPGGVDLLSSIMGSSLGQRPRFTSCHPENSALCLGLIGREGHWRPLKGKSGIARMVSPVGWPGSSCARCTAWPHTRVPPLAFHSGTAKHFHQGGITPGPWASQGSRVWPVAGNASTSWGLVDKAGSQAGWAYD